MVQASVGVGGEDSERSISLEWDRVRCFDKDVAQMFLGQVRSENKFWFWS